jgi:hypothetical protein
VGQCELLNSSDRLKVGTEFLREREYDRLLKKDSWVISRKIDHLDAPLYQDLFADYQRSVKAEGGHEVTGLEFPFWEWSPCGMG